MPGGSGARPPPADFAEVMGYQPYLIQTPGGPRMQDPHGYASSPGGIGPVEDFDKQAKTHDYGYDILRYYAKKGAELGPDARKAADQMFRDDLFTHANGKDGFGERWKARTWAQIFASAVELVNANPYGNGVAIFTRDGGAARQFQFDVQAGMVGVNVPIPVPVAYYSFGGWKASLFGDTHMYGPDGVHFYTRTKVVTSRWPDPSTSTVDLGFPRTR